MPATETYHCRHCEVTKPLSAFFKRSDATRPYHVRSQCKVCYRTARRTYEMRNAAHTAKAHKFKHIRAKYGVTENQYHAIMRAQEDRCPICRDDFTNEWGPKYPCVDHCHRTKKVRGILCRNCNSVLGALREDPKIIRQLVAYLEHHK